MQKIITVRLHYKGSNKEINTLLVKGWKIIGHIKYKIHGSPYVDYIIEKNE